HNSASEVKAWIEDAGDCASCRITTHHSGKAGLEINDELRVNERGNRSKVNMPKVCAQSEAFDPFRTVNRPVRPFIGDLRLQEGISTLDYLNRGAIGCQSLRIGKAVFPEGGETFSSCWRQIG